MAKGTGPKATALVARLDRGMAYIRRHFADPILLPEVAAAAGLSPFYFHRHFRRQFGETPKEVISRLRVERAKELILRGVPLPEVARRCGFAHQSHLTMRFKMETGIPPKRWLRQERAERGTH